MAKDLRHIDWEQEAEKVIISSHEEWNEFAETLDWDLYIPFEATVGIRTSRSTWVDGRWSYRMDGESPAVYIGYGMYKHVIVKFAERNRGTAALRVLKEKMAETNGKKFQARFGAFKQNKDPSPFDKTKTNLWFVKAIHEINRCVGPFVGNASLQKNQWFDNGLYKADVSSAYPAAGCYNLPDIRKSKLVNGYVEPSEEWPIVFYLVNHHIAEYGVFDTHDDMIHPLYKWYRNRGDRKVHRTKKKKEWAIHFLPFTSDEICLCCKYSDYDLREFEYFYEQKKISEDAKNVMNYSIGTFDMINSPNMEILPSKMDYFGHLRAIICARHNHNMIKYYDEIIKSGYNVIQVQTDSIIWQGGMIESASRNKKLGALHLEIENGHGFIHGCGAYWVEDENNAIEKHQGIRGWNSDEINTLEKFIEYFKNHNNVRFEEWVLNPDNLKFELLEV